MKSQRPSRLFESRVVRFSPRTIVQLCRRMGLRWLVWRFGYALRKKTFLYRRKFPVYDASGFSLEPFFLPGVPTDPQAYREYRANRSTPFFFAAGGSAEVADFEQLLSAEARESAVRIADDFARGVFLYYSRQRFDLGWPVQWLYNPVAQCHHHARLHWCDYPTFDRSHGDIKDVWEPSRFACAFWLVRAYALTGSERYPEAFWELFESWCGQNPVNMGPNWKCGQEVALRSLAWIFALYGFWRSPRTTPERVAQMVAVLAMQARRIEDNIGFAISQKSNHGISEAVGLLTIGCLFPELRRSQRWLRLGRSVFEKEIRRQLYADGSYAMHSMNYHRFVLQLCTWALRLGELNEIGFVPDVRERIAVSAEFLFQMTDPQNGRAPNYGSNDGAYVLPLSSCDYADYRPAVYAALAQAGSDLPREAGDWDEALLWLFGAQLGMLTRTERMPATIAFPHGSYYTMRGDESWCMVRCHTYQDRPSHVDMLHMDLWFKGCNVLGDSGSYRYYVPEDSAFECYFKDIGAHNTVEIDQKGPLELFSRFLWMPWPRAVCEIHSEDCWQGVHYAYDRPPWGAVHRRAIRREGETAWIVADEILGEGEHVLALRWHVADGSYHLDVASKRVRFDLPCGQVTLVCSGPAGFDMQVHRGVAKDGYVAGWMSQYYGECVCRPTVEVSVRCALPVKFTTRILLGDGCS